jgi:hypothetical protein
MRASLLDRPLNIGGKCGLFNGSGKSPGLNQLVSGELLRMHRSTDESFGGGKNFKGDFFLTLRTNQSPQSVASNVSYLEA